MKPTDKLKKEKSPQLKPSMTMKKSESKKALIKKEDIGLPKSILKPMQH
jgi:hypothetical protein